MTRSLDVFIDAARVATLFENQGIWSLHYDPEWLRSGFDLAPGLPLSAAPIVDSGSVRPVQWFFDNLLPEDAADLLKRACAAKSRWQDLGVDAL